MNTTNEPGPGAPGTGSEPGVGPPPDPTPPPPRPRRLTRTPDDKVVAGVAGGLGAYFGLDPVIFRIAFVALALLGGGTGILLYVIGWIAMPEGEPGAGARPPSAGGGGTVVVAVVLLVVGGLLFLERLARMGDPWGPTRGFWPGFGLPLIPLALVGLGIWILLAQRDQPGPAPRPLDGTDGPAPGSYWAGAGGPARPYAADEPATGTSIPAPPPPGAVPGAPAGPAGPGAPTGSEGPGGPGGPGAPGGPPPPGAWSAPPAAVRPRRSPLGATVLSILLIVGGVAAMLDVTGALSVPLVGFLAVALVVTGAGLIVGAWWGRARGLIALGIVLTLLLGFARVVDVNVAGGIGERMARPTTVAQVQDGYRLGMGSLTLDLSGIDDLAAIGPVRARVGIGELIVVVPPDAAVDVHARSGVGEVVLFGHSQGGVGVEERRIEPPVADASPRREGSGRPSDPVTIELDAQVGIGKVEVRHG